MEVKEKLTKYILSTENKKDELDIIITQDSIFFLIIPDRELLEELKKQGLDFEGEVILCG